jgi:hypothetical protein
LGARFDFWIRRRFCLSSSSPYVVRTGSTNGPAHLPYCVSPSLLYPGIGMLTDCPSPTLLSLGLGPTNPMWTDLASETLGIRRSWFSHDLRYSYRHSHFCSLHHSFRYGFVARRTLLYCPLAWTRIFGGVLSPVIFSAQNRSTSQLLRTV